MTLGANKAIQDLVAALKNIPAAVIAPERIGQPRPARALDLPAIAVSIGPVREGPIGIGGVVGMAFDGARWTTTTGTSFSGLLQTEIWAADSGKASEIADAVFAVLAGSAAALRDSGFIRLTTEAIRPMETVALADATSSVRAVLEFSVVHEEIAGLVTGPGGIIREIDVEIDSQFNEKMTVK